MILTVLRALFILLMAAVGWFYLTTEGAPLGEATWLLLTLGVSLGTLIVCIDILAPRRKLAILSGSVLGIVVGLCVAYALSFAVRLIVDQIDHAPTDAGKLEMDAFAVHHKSLIDFVDLLVGVSACYLSISFILQTKDDFRFIIPYVEFSKQTKGPRPLLLDANVLIDGRIADLAGTGIFDAQLVVPRFVQAELQRVADSADRVARARGRRGLDLLAKLKAAGKPEIKDYDTARNEKDVSGRPLDVDERLVALARELHARILTNDIALAKIAQIRGVDVVNLNELATALRPSVIPGEHLRLHVLRRGEEPGQGVGFLDDGTLVVIEQGQTHIGEEIDVLVTNTKQSAQGRMIFAKASADGAATAARQLQTRP